MDPGCQFQEFSRRRVFYLIEIALLLALKSFMCMIYIFIHINITMRTNIVIDDELMKQVLKLTGLKTKREAVEQGLKTLLRLKRQEQIRDYRGKLQWEGNLDDMRRD